MTRRRNVAGKRMLVTGAAMGMGTMCVGLAVAEGAESVVPWDINETVLTETTRPHH